MALGAAVEFLIRRGARNGEVLLPDGPGVSAKSGYIVLGMGKLGSRELTADDYIYQIKRLALPRPPASSDALLLAQLAEREAGQKKLTAIVTAISSGASDADSTPSTAVGVVRVVVGLVFLGLAVKTWRGRPRPGEETPMPGWMASLDQSAPGRTLVLGAALSGLNPKIMALAISAAASISQADLDPTETALAAAAFVAIGSSTVLLAVGAHLLAAERAAGPLATLKRFMIDHNTAIMLVVLVVLGANILGEGIATPQEAARTAAFAPLLRGCAKLVAEARAIGILAAPFGQARPGNDQCFMDNFKIVSARIAFARDQKARGDEFFDDFVGGFASA